MCSWWKFCSKKIVIMMMTKMKIIHHQNGVCDVCRSCAKQNAINVVFVEWVLWYFFFAVFLERVFNFGDCLRCWVANVWRIFFFMDGNLFWFFVYLKRKWDFKAHIHMHFKPQTNSPDVDFLDYYTMRIIIFVFHIYAFQRANNCV